MSKYVCYNCRQISEIEKVVGEIACKNCSCKILFKAPAATVKRVSCD